jgi:hypothetical protein
MAAMSIPAVKLLDLNGQREETVPTFLAYSKAASETDDTDAHKAAGSNLIAEQLGVDKRTAQRVQLFADAKAEFQVQLAHLGDPTQLARLAAAASASQ